MATGNEYIYFFSSTLGSHHAPHIYIPNQIEISLRNFIQFTDARIKPPRLGASCGVLCVYEDCLLMGYFARPQMTCFPGIWGARKACHLGERKVIRSWELIYRSVSHCISGCVDSCHLRVWKLVFAARQSFMWTLLHRE